MPGETFARETRYAGYPSAVMFDEPNGKAVQHLLWGDWLELSGPARDGWLPVHGRGHDGWMRQDTVTHERLLEIVFVDIGQGDGALVVTPDDRHLLVDAGQGDNMFRFLRWKYRLKKPFSFAAAVISHSDVDHYAGFGPILANPNVDVGTIYHNGIVERAGTERFGAREGGYLTGLVDTREELERLLAPAENRGRLHYPRLLFDALSSGRVGDIRALSSNDKHLPGFAPDGVGGVAVEVLGPVRDHGTGVPRLPWLGDLGKTKNGHSVVLRLVYRDISILLGGDLNTSAEHHLLSSHTGYPAPPRSESEAAALLEGARRVFRSDIAKACHHGSADFTDLFLRAVDPIATVISSGDNEPHSHPRADSLGAVGRWGRGRRPLVFSTELARSAPDMISHPCVLRTRIRAAQSKVNAASEGKAREHAQADLDKLIDKIDRSVAVFGAINLRTDGNKVVVAQKIEAPRAKDKKWDIYRLERDGNGVLVYLSKHDRRIGTL